MPSTRPTTPNGELIADMYAAFERGDFENVLAVLDPDIEWIETESESLPVHGQFAGPQEVLVNVFAPVPQLFSEFELRPQLWIEAGDDVVVTGRVVARSKGGQLLSAPFAHVFTVRDGRVIRTDNFHDTALWLTALK